MNALLLAVVDELRGGVVGVKFDLVDSRNDLAAGVVQELLKVLNAKVGDTNVTDLAGGGKLLHLLPRTWSARRLSMQKMRDSYQVLMKSQSGRCFDRSLGSVELGQ